MGGGTGGGAAGGLAGGTSVAGGSVAGGLSAGGAAGGGVAGGAAAGGAAGDGGVSSWAPSAGELKVISHPPGFFGPRGGATLAEIDPIYQSWHPAFGTGNSFSLPFGSPTAAGWASINAYCGMLLNPDTREYTGYGAGHSAICVNAPYAFNLNDLRWKWLDEPLPFDGYHGLSPWTRAAVEARYTQGELNYEWGELQGDSPAWGAHARPGVIQPIPCHSRAMNAVIPEAKSGIPGGAFFKFDCAGGKTGGLDGTANSHLFGYGTRAWQRTANLPPSMGGSGARGAAYDPRANVVVVFGAASATDRFAIFDVASRTWRERRSTNTKATAVDNGSVAMHEASRLFIIPASRSATNQPSSPGNAATSGVTYEFFAVDLDALLGTAPFSIQTLTVTVASTWPRNAAGRNDYIGWSYCPEDGRLYAAASENGTNTYWRLSPPAGARSTQDHLLGAWTLTEHTFDRGLWIESLAVLNQYNRLQWDQASRAFIWHSGYVNDPVMAFRPHGL